MRTIIPAECVYGACIPAQTQNLLSALTPALAPRRFVLAGGTALTLYLGHRVSADLDLFSAQPFSIDILYRSIEQRGMNPTLLQEAEGTLTVTIAGIKVSLFHYPYPFIEEQAAWNGIMVAGILDIAAMKLIAIAQRGAKRDFVDLYFIARDIPFRKIAENAVRRFGKSRINPVHIGKSLVYFSEAEGDPEPQYCCEVLPFWDEIKRFFVTNIQQMVLDLQRAKDQIA